MAYNSPNDVFNDPAVSGWGTDPNTVILENIINYSFAGLIQVHDAISDKPLHGGADEYTWIHGQNLNVLFQHDADAQLLASIGGHDLSENVALSYAMIVNRVRRARDGAYSAAKFDEFMDPVDDVSLSVRASYQVLQI